ncbi:MAG: hypothetical protein IPM32_12645 [Ignavibacteriae bacterium]|nr:hypothetical protein [Ignavibacteriota bacterium]
MIIKTFTFMFKIIENKNSILISEELSPVLRFFIFFIGLSPLIFTPYELLIKPHWNEFSFIIVIPIIISFGAIFVGGTFIIVSIWGLDKFLEINFERKYILYSHKTFFGSLFKHKYKLTDLNKIEIAIHDWSDGPTTYSLEFHISKKIMNIGDFKKHDEAELLKSNITHKLRIE